MTGDTRSPSLYFIAPMGGSFFKEAHKMNLQITSCTITVPELADLEFCTWFVRSSLVASVVLSFSDNSVMTKIKISKKL